MPHLGEPTVPPMPYSYLIFKRGIYTKARNGTTGAIDYCNITPEIVIQWTNDHLPTGGKILIKKGTYICNTTITLNSNITIEGEGPTTILKRIDNCTDPLAQILRLLNVDNVKIRNLTLDGNRANNLMGAHAEPQMSNISLEGTTSNCSIENCNIIESVRTGIHMTTTCLRNKILNNNIIGGDHDGIEAAGDYNIIAKNVIEGFNDPLTTGFNPSGIELETRSRHTTVMGNTLKNCWYGIDNDGATDLENICNTISENTIEDSIKIGIRVYYAPSNTIGNNTVLGGEVGISVIGYSPETTVIGNTIRDCTVEGLTLDHSYEASAIGNIIKNCYDGLNLKRMEDGLVAGNVIVDNERLGINITHYAAEYSLYNYVIGNKITGTHSTAAVAVGAGDNENVIIENDLRRVTGVVILDNGTGTIIDSNEGNVGRYQTTANAWAGYAGPTGTATNGARTIVYSSGEPGHRLYCYSNGAWHYVNLT